MRAWRVAQDGEEGGGEDRTPSRSLVGESNAGHAAH